jgi:hypothetical protein
MLRGEQGWRYRRGDLASADELIPLAIAEQQFCRFISTRGVHAREDILCQVLVENKRPPIGGRS